MEDINGTSIKGCIRCGERHDDITLQPLNNPTDNYTYWCICPVSKQPILVYAQVAEMVKKVVGG